MTLKEIKEILDRPLPDESVKPHPTQSYLSAIKAIYVIERFNEAFGLGGWFVNNEFVEKVSEEKTNKKGGKYQSRMVVIKASFQAKVGDTHILVSDIFGGNDNPDLGDAYKGACTDALTKIGSYLGVGMDVFKGLHGKTPAKQEIKPVIDTPYKATGDAATNDKPKAGEYTDCEECGAKKKNTYKTCYPCSMKARGAG